MHCWKKGLGFVQALGNLLPLGQASCLHTSLKIQESRAVGLGFGGGQRHYPSPPNNSSLPESLNLTQSYNPKPYEAKTLL